METTHDEQVSTMLRIQAEVGILKRKHKSSGRLYIGQINSLRKLSIEMEGLEKAFKKNNGNVNLNSLTTLPTNL